MVYLGGFLAGLHIVHNGWEFVTTRAKLRGASASAGSCECTYVAIVKADDALGWKRVHPRPGTGVDHAIQLACRPARMTEDINLIGMVLFADPRNSTR
jgi:hypothetical protein